MANATAKIGFKTTFEEDLLQEMKLTAIRCSCNVNDLLAISYHYLMSKKNHKQIKEMIKGECK